MVTAKNMMPDLVLSLLSSVALGMAGWAGDYWVALVSDSPLHCLYYPYNPHQAKYYPFIP